MGTDRTGCTHDHRPHVRCLCSSGRLILTHRSLFAPLAGLITGVRLAAKSLEPSLMPRSAVDQGLVMAGSFVTGYVVGSVGSQTLAHLPLIGGAPATRVAGLAVTGARFSHLLENTKNPDAVDAREASAWAETGSDALTSIAIARTVLAGDKPVVAALGGLGVVAATVSDVQAALQSRDDTVDAMYLATATGTAAGAVTVLGGLVGTVKLSGRLARRWTRTSGLVGAAVYTGATLITISALGVGVRILVGKALGAIANGNSAVEIAYSTPPMLETVSGGPSSLALYSSLGLQGRRLVSVATSSEAISEVMGEEARCEPVRVFIGIESADSEHDRVELAIAELRRAGGFDRSAIIAASPAGTGYVNYITIEGAELMARGDIATVAVQYGSLPSMLSMNRVEDASRLYGALVSRLRSEIDSIDRDISLYAYGESLGSQTSMNGIDGIAGPTDLPIDGALWVGTPQGTALFDQLTESYEVPVFDRPDQLADLIESDSPRPPATLLNHDNDPVTKFSPSLFHRMPDWLKSNDRGRGSNPHQRWLPGVAFWQGLIDTKNAATVVPGEFKSTGHDYRADLASFIRVAYGFDDVTETQMTAIEEKLRASEIERAENISQGTVQSA